MPRSKNQPPARTTLADLETIVPKGVAQVPNHDPMAYHADGVNAKPKRDKRWRGQIRFWLDAAKPAERALGEWLEGLKRRRQLQPTIRNALRLFADLKAGNTAVLLELFPGIVEALQQTIAVQQFKDMLGDAARSEIRQALAAGVPAPSSSSRELLPRPLLPAAGEAVAVAAADSGDSSQIFFDSLL